MSHVSDNGGGPPTIGRDDRDLLVDLMAYRYFVTGDLRIMRELDHGVGDEESATRFRDDLALMSDLGWLPRWCLGQVGLPESEKEEFEIWLPPARLRGAIERALADARRHRRREPHRWRAARTTSSTGRHRPARRSSQTSMERRNQGDHQRQHETEKSEAATQTG